MTPRGRPPAAAPGRTGRAAGRPFAPFALDEDDVLSRSTIVKSRADSAFGLRASLRTDSSSAAKLSGLVPAPRGSSAYCLR
jgi:hypothetical protein